MKKMLALSLILLPVFMHADGELAMGSKSSMDKKNKNEEQTPFIEYHNRMAVFGPMHQVYERTKTDAFYVGVEGWIAGTVGSKKASVIEEGELRFGYNLFYNGRDHLTPFVGGGIFHDSTKYRYKTEHKQNANGVVVSHHKRSTLPSVAYGVIGILYDHEFTSVFNMGANFKAFGGGAIGHRSYKWGSAVIGLDVSFPITFRFGHKRHWDYRIEPFNIFVHGNNVNVYYFGGRSTLGYRF